MKVERISHARKHGGNHIWLSLHRKADVTDKPFIQDFVNDVAVVHRAVSFAHDARALADSKRIRHGKPRKETRRGVDSRRRRGMSGIQQTPWYHVRRRASAWILSATTSAGVRNKPAVET